MVLPDEVLDIVDENDNVIGQKNRSEIYRERLSNFRVVNVFLVNSKGQLWIPRRSDSKRIFPSCLDVSMGGHVESGESYEDALVRELHEELNLSVNLSACTVLGYLLPHTDNVSAFMKVYEIKMDETPLYNRDDFSESFWLMPDDVLTKIAEGDRCKDDLPKLVERFYIQGHN